MKAVLAALLLAASIGHVAAQQDVPRIDYAASCRAAAKGALGMPQDYEGCRRSEEAARDALAKQWTGFLPADRASCHRLTTLGTPGTYTELLTCLEMKRDARNLPDTSTVGRGLSPRR